MRYFVNSPYSLSKLSNEMKAYCRTMHPNFGGNAEEFTAMINEYSEISDKIKEQYKKNKKNCPDGRPYDPKQPPAEGLSLVKIAGGVAVVGPKDITFQNRKEIMMHGGEWNFRTQRHEAKTKGAIKELYRWFKNEPIEYNTTDDGPLTLGKLAAMAERGQLFNVEKQAVKVGQFDTYAEFLCTFGAQYYYILKRIAEGNINLNDFKPLQYLAADLIAAFGFDLPDEDGAK